MGQGLHHLGVSLSNVLSHTTWFYESSGPDFNNSTSHAWIKRSTKKPELFCRTWTNRYLVISQTRVKRVSRVHHRAILGREWPVMHAHLHPCNPRGPSFWSEMVNDVQQYIIRYRELGECSLLGDVAKFHQDWGPDLCESLHANSPTDVPLYVHVNILRGSPVLPVWLACTLISPMNNVILFLQLKIAWIDSIKHGDSDRLGGLMLYGSS